MLIKVKWFGKWIFEVHLVIEKENDNK